MLRNIWQALNPRIRKPTIIKIPHDSEDGNKRIKSTYNLRFPQTKQELTRLTILTVFVLLLLGWTVYELFGPLSPNGIKNLAIRALERRDANELCRLADPVEISRLHLTPDNVTALLYNTLWSEPWAKMVKEKRDHTTPDMAVFETQWQTPTKQPYRKDVIGIFIIEDHQKSWHLVLSDVLYNTCIWKYGLIPGSRKNIDLSKKYGIIGIEDGYHGTYSYYR